MILHGMDSEVGPQDAYEPTEIAGMTFVHFIHVVYGRGFMDFTRFSKGVPKPQS